MTTWNDVSGPSTSWSSIVGDEERYLACEDDVFLLTEDGLYIILEEYIGALGWGNLTGPSTSWTNVT